VQPERSVLMEPNRISYTTVDQYSSPCPLEAQGLAKYKGAKGSVQFSLEKPLPCELISEIVKFRVAENIEQAEDKLS